MRGLLYASLALTIGSISAHPLSQHSKGLAKRTVDLNAFRLKVASDYTNSTSVDTDPPLGITKRAANEDTATELVKKKVPGATFRLVESYTGTNSVAHFYFKQTANGIDIDNADFNVNVSQYSRADLHLPRT
jgi:extracellular elastinolytic metalloproteinase